MPGGALAVTDGDQIIPIINKLFPKYDLVIFANDWHENNNIYFAASHEGKQPFEQIEIHGKLDTLWPIHAVKNTEGADFHDDLQLGLIKGDFYIFRKGTLTNSHPYGAFGDKMETTGLEEYLNSKNVKTVHVCGLATDFCVKDTAVDAAKLGFETFVILDATRSINPDLEETLKIFKDNNVNLINSDKIL